MKQSYALAAATAVAPPRPAAVASVAQGQLILERFAVVGLLLIAAYLRLSHLGLVQYRYDDDTLWSIVTGMAQTGRLPQTGMPSSTGLPNGPFQALLLAPFGWLGANPPLMTAGIGLLNVVAAALVYGFARDFFGRRVALLALLLTAANPWAVVFSRRLWGDDMVAPFAVLILWLLARWLFRADRRAILVVGGALGIVSQVYIVGIECAAPVVAALLLAGQRLRTRWVLLAALLFAALMAPYTIAVIAPSIPVMLQHFTDHSRGPAVFDANPVHFALQLASNEGYQAFAMQEGTRLDATSGLPGALGLFARLLYLLGLGVGVWTVLRGPGRLRAETRGIHVLLLAAVLVPIALLVRHGPEAPVYPYYFVTTFPLPYLYGAIAVNQLWQWSERLPASVGALAQGATALLLAALFLVQLALAGAFFATAQEYWPTGNYGLPWQTANQIVGEASQLERQYGLARVLIPTTDVDNLNLYTMLRRGATNASSFDGGRLLVLSGEPALYVTFGNSRAAQVLATAFAQDQVREERLPGAGTIVRFFVIRLPAAPPLPASASTLGWTADGLLRLDQLALPSRLTPGQPVEATVSMTALKQPGPDVPDFSLFVHLLGADGAAVVKMDGGTFASSNWQPGDRIIQWFDATVPAGAQPGLLTASLGLYSTGTPSRPGIYPLSLSGPAGQPLGASARGPRSVIAPPAPAAPQHATAVQFADGIRLNGYDVAQAGDVLTVTLHWSAAAPGAHNLTAFVHVLDSAGKLVAQHDGPPALGQFPTAFWQPGDRLADAHPIRLPPNLPPGAYRLEFGLYDAQTLARLPVVAGAPDAAIALPAR